MRLGTEYRNDCIVDCYQHLHSGEGAPPASKEIPELDHDEYGAHVADLDLHRRILLNMDKRMPLGTRV